MLQPEDFTEERVVGEAEKIQYIYTLKHVIRFGQSRTDTDYTESVAEHIFGMYVIADYFRPLEDPEQKLDMGKVYSLITWHEMDEIETGDIPAVRKTDADRAVAAQMLQKSLGELPETLNSHVRGIVQEYESQTSSEARYVKAIDKIEPLIHSFHPLGKYAQHDLKLTTKSSVEIKEKYIASYPYIRRFSDVLHHVMDREGYFYPGD